MNAIRLCEFASPPGDYECREAVYSQGKSCKKCNVKCYRQGMSSKEATADNKRLVSLKATKGE